MILSRLTPWLPETAVTALEEILNEGKDLKVFEYGCGMSTVWMSLHKNVQSVTSIEHDTTWAIDIGTLIGNHHRATIYPGDRPYHGRINGLFYAPYASNGMYDIILIDGRDRVKCIEAAIPHLKPGGILILDNSEREYYQRGIDLMEKWDKLYFYQPQPDRYGFTYPNWQCTFFFKPETSNPK